MLVTEEHIIKEDGYVRIELMDRYNKKKGEMLIDEDDLCKITHKNIFLMSTGYVSIYPNNIGVHRILTNASKNEIVDHINGDRSDNRKCNLRKVDRSKNGINRSKHRNNKTGHRGVFYVEEQKKYNAYITVDWHRKNLGYFDKIEDAIKARIDAEKHYFKDYYPDEYRYNKKYERTEKKYKEV